MTKEAHIFLQHILESIKMIDEFTKDCSKQNFVISSQLHDAVIRRLEIIGEAIKNLPKDLLVKYSDVKWSDFTKMRDKLIHGYFGVDLEITWDTVKNDIPELKKKIKKY